MVEPEVIYENEDFLAVNKPAGLLVHSAGHRGADEATLVNWLVDKYPEIKRVGDEPRERPGIVHRLDKDTSGVMLVARTQKYFDYLKSLFQKHLVKKTYLALVFGVPEKREGIITKPIGIKSGTTRRTVHLSKFSKEAETFYRVKKAFGSEGGSSERFALLEVRPETGRTHQIRVHLAGSHHPVVGDCLYGRKVQPPWAARLMLHAWALEFSAADGRRLRVEAEPPDDYERVVVGLELSPK